jgi:hypothetical protein
MINQIENLPENTLGFIYTGQVTGKDYETVIFPAIKAMANSVKKMRFLICFDDQFSTIGFKALLDDTMVGFKYFGDWERMALVSDHSAINQVIGVFSFLMPGSVKVFPMSDYDAAITWLEKKDEVDH